MPGQRTKRPRRAARATAPAYCRWVDVVGRDPAQLERVRHRLGLSPRLVALSLVEHLHPVVIRVPRAWFLVTYFTAPSRRNVFGREPLCIWLADYAIVTISPWARRRIALGACTQLDETRDEFLCRIIDAALSSHEDVAGQLDRAFLGEDRARKPLAWHWKEHRVAVFRQLLAYQLELVRTVGLENARMRQASQQLTALAQIAQQVDRTLRRSGRCRICHDAAAGRRRGQ